MKRLLLIALVLISSVAYATVSNQSVSVTYSCSGSVGPYSFTFPISDTSSLAVIQDGTTLSSSAYSVSPVNNNYANGGSVTLLSACNSPSILVLKRETPVTQTTVYTDNMPTPMKTFERSLDKLTEIAIEQSADINLLGNWGCPANQIAIGFSSLLPVCSTPITGPIPTWESPGTIGSVTPNTGAFTTLKAGTVTPTFSNTATGGTELNSNGQVFAKVTDLTPAATTYAGWFESVGGKSSGGALGTGAVVMKNSDDATVTSLNKGILYGNVISLSPSVDRNNVPNDDATGMIIQNNGTGKATDAIYIGAGALSGKQWATIFSSTPDSDYGFLLYGAHTYGFDFKPGTYSSQMIRGPSNTALLGARNNTDSADLNLVSTDAGNSMHLGSVSVNGVYFDTDLHVSSNTAFINALKVGASGSTISDSRNLVQAVYECGSTTTCSHTALVSDWIVWGEVALSSASPSQATVTGFSPAFTSTSTYTCTCSAQGNTAAVAAGGCAVTKASASSITLTGPNTVTTVVGYQCIGH